MEKIEHRAWSIGHGVPDKQKNGQVSSRLNGKDRFNPDGIRTSKTFHWASRTGGIKIELGRPRLNSPPAPVE
jgi:hypothetical protein